MKKIQYFVSVMLLVTFVFAFTGCGKSEKASSKDVSKITIWTKSSHSKLVYDELVSKYNNGQGKKDGIYVDYIVHEGDSYSQKIELGLQTDSAPDMFAMPTADITSLVEKNQIVSYEDLPGGEEFVKEYENNKNLYIEEYHTYNGKTYCVPYGATTQGLLYNKDMFRAAGIVDKNGEPTPPKTFEEMRKYAKILSNSNKKEFGIIFPLKWVGWVSSDVTSLMQSSAGFIGYNTVTGEYDYSVAVDVLNTYMGMKEDGSVFPGAEGLDNDSARAHFSNGGIGMKTGFSFDVGVLNNQFPAKIDWGVAPYPVVDENEIYKQRMDVGRSFAINSKSVDTIGGDKLLNVIKYFTSKEFAIETYKAGVELPYSWDIVKDVELVDAPKGWEEFCAMTEISSVYCREPRTDMSGELNFEDRVKQQVWTGEKTPQQVVDEFEKVITKARNRYYDNNPTKNMNKFINKDWNIRR